MGVPPPPYAMLGNQGSLHHQQPPPYRRPIPRYGSSNSRRGSYCCRFICGCCCCLFLFVFIVTCLMAYFYYALDPKTPSYQVQNLDVKTLDIHPNTGLNISLLLSIKAENPNQHIGITYRKDSSVIVMYKDTNLCSGILPSFYQGYENTTVMNISLNGKTKFNLELQAGLLESKKGGRIPMLVIVKAPIELLAGGFLSSSFVVHVDYSLVLDNLSPKKKVSILSSNYTVHVTM